VVHLTAKTVVYFTVHVILKCGCRSQNTTDWPRFGHLYIKIYHGLDITGCDQQQEYRIKLWS